MYDTLKNKRVQIDINLRSFYVWGQSSLKLDNLTKMCYNKMYELILRRKYAEKK